MSEPKIIDANQLDSNAFIIDVRTKMEHDEKRLKLPHKHIPLDELDPEKDLQTCNLSKDSNIYFLCRGGVRAKQAADKFSAIGCKNVHVIKGGIISCEECGKEVEGHVNSTGKNPISLERQVRIAAGAIAFSGALLALISNPFFALIPLFVGGGLMFAGITDRCGMALLLTKAPWNKK